MARTTELERRTLEDLEAALVGLFSGRLVGLPSPGVVALRIPLAGTTMAGVTFSVGSREGSGLTPCWGPNRGDENAEKGFTLSSTAGEAIGVGVAA